MLGLYVAIHVFFKHQDPWFLNNVDPLLIEQFNLGEGASPIGSWVCMVNSFRLS